MQSRDFCYWLMGYYELTGDDMLSDMDRKIKKHLMLVFEHEIDPSAGPPQHQTKLDEIHQGTHVPDSTFDGPNFSKPPKMRC